MRTGHSVLTLTWSEAARHMLSHTCSRTHAHRNYKVYSDGRWIYAVIHIDRRRTAGHLELLDVSTDPLRRGLLGMARTQEKCHLGSVEDFWTTGHRDPEEESQMFCLHTWSWSRSWWSSGCCVLPACGPSPCSITAILTARKTRTFTWASMPNTNLEGKNFFIL